MSDRKKYISENAPAKITDLLSQSGFDVISVAPASGVTTPIASHPDIQMCRLGITDDSPVVFALPGELGSEYPADIPFNAACTGKYFIHNLKYTAPRLLELAKKQSMTLVNVSQGYAKCSCVIVDENSIITYDRGIADKCSQAGMSVLLVEPGHVILEGYNTGFIGGASGRINDSIIFCGDIDVHPDAARIKEFIEDKDLNVISFDFPLTDIGSII